MFKFLDEIDRNLYSRYLTLERNIKAGSNSFYDAYLDLQEQLIKYILAEQSFEIKLRDTCGAILRREDIKTYLTNVLLIDEYTYCKMQDYTLKVNAHKHKGEKTIQAETAVNYLHILHNTASAYAKSKGIAAGDFDDDYIRFIFGAFEKENSELKSEMKELKEELANSVQEGKLKDSDIAVYRGLLSQTELDKMSLEEQNNELQRQISKLKDIKLSSMEDKLNRSIEMLLTLQASVAETRAVSYAVGESICGKEGFIERVATEKKNFNFSVYDQLEELKGSIAEASQPRNLDEQLASNDPKVFEFIKKAKRVWRYAGELTDFAKATKSSRITAVINLIMLAIQIAIPFFHMDKPNSWILILANTGFCLMYGVYTILHYFKDRNYEIPYDQISDIGEYYELDDNGIMQKPKTKIWLMALKLITLLVLPIIIVVFGGALYILLAVFLLPSYSVIMPLLDKSLGSKNYVLFFIDGKDEVPYVLLKDFMKRNKLK